MDALPYDAPGEVSMVSITNEQRQRVMTIFRQTVNTMGNVRGPEKAAYKSIVKDLEPIAAEIRVPPWLILQVLKEEVQGIA